MELAACWGSALSLPRPPAPPSASEIFPYLVVVIGLENVLVLTKSVVSTPVDLEVKLRIAQGRGRAGAEDGAGSAGSSSGATGPAVGDGPGSCVCEEPAGLCGCGFARPRPGWTLLPPPGSGPSAAGAGVWVLGKQEPRPGGLNTCDPSSQPHIWGPGLGAVHPANLRVWGSQALRQMWCRGGWGSGPTQSRSARGRRAFTPCRDGSLGPGLRQPEGGYWGGGCLWRLGPSPVSTLEDRGLRVDT